MSLPTVTCLVCVYDYERYIAEAIDSALAQDYPAELLEILVIDDGSTDRTPEILAGYGDRIRVVRQSNAGLNAATQRGIEEARGELIALLDADDAWLPGKVRAQVALIQARPEVGLVFCDEQMMDADGRTFAASFFRHYDVTPIRGAHALEALLFHNFVPAPTIMFRREHIAQVLPFVPETPCQDWWIAVRVAEVAEIDYVAEPLVRYRVHGDNMSAIGEQIDLATASGRRMLRNWRNDAVFRRWMLRTLPLGNVRPEVLRAAWESFFGGVVGIAAQAGTREADEAPVTDAHVAERELALAAARTAAERGDLNGSVRQAVAARAADPFHAGARRLLRDLGEAADRADAAEEAAAPPDGATDHERLTWAEERYADGDPAAAVEELLALAASCDDPGLLAQVHGDLAVVAHGAGDPATAADAAREALRHDGQALGALELLAQLATEAGDHGQAVHWLTRATGAAPADPALWRALGAAEHARARWAESVQALRVAEGLGALDAEGAGSLAEAEAELAVARSATPAPGAAAGEGRGRALICVDHFHPSMGGSERLAEGVGVALAALGWDVHVACRADPRRTAGVRRGLRVHEVRSRPREELRELARRLRPDGVLAFSDAYAWPVLSTMRLPDGGPRRVVVPCINTANDRRLRTVVKDLSLWRALLDRADAVVHCSQAGYDARLNRSLGVEAAYVPNATEQETPAGSLRARLGIPDGEPVLLVVANFYPLKNHAGLLEALAGRPGDFHLVFAGHPATRDEQRPEETARLERLMAAEPRLHLAGGLAPAEVAAAMEEADLLLLPSLNEATPLVLLEAMSRRLPWIATPACGAAAEWAGGLITDAERFGEAIDHLLDDPAARSVLASAGREHWEACFTYDAIGARYDALLRGARALPDLPAPAAALESTDRERARLLDAFVAPHATAAA